MNALSNSVVTVILATLKRSGRKIRTKIKIKIKIIFFIIPPIFRKGIKYNTIEKIIQKEFLITQIPIVNFDREMRGIRKSIFIVDYKKTR